MATLCQSDGGYLEAYARDCDLPFRTNTRVDALSRASDRFRVIAGNLTFEADNVVVAMANSSRHHPTWLAGEEAGAIPFRIEPFLARNVLVRGVRFVGHHLLTVRTPIGRKIRPNFLARATPLIRVKPKDFTPAGVTRVGRIVDVRDGFPVTEDAQTIDVTNIIWCTGHRPGFSWIDLPIMGDRQEPNTSVAWFRRNSAFTSSTAIRGA